jgi:hypothetical protein
MLHAAALPPHYQEPQHNDYRGVGCCIMALKSGLSAV